MVVGIGGKVVVVVVVDVVVVTTETKCKFDASRS